MLALKLVLVPSLICAITLAGRQWGPAVAGWLSGFPIVSAPVLFFLAAEQGSRFAATAAGATLSAVPAVLLFVTAYAWLATRAGWRVSLLCSLVAYFAAIALLYLLAPPVYAAAPLVYAVIWVAPRFFPPTAVFPKAPPFRPSELVLRMTAGGALVLAVTYFAADLGARWSGLFAMFPVLGIVLAVFSHRQAGAAFTVHLLRGVVFGFYAFTSFCLLLALALPAMGVGAAFALALGSATFIQWLARNRLRMRIA